MWLLFDDSKTSLGGGGRIRRALALEVLLTLTEEQASNYNEYLLSLQKKNPALQHGLAQLARLGCRWGDA